jgi:ABC-type transport system involved in multi-copper enzyme maturation permease subunit
LSALCAIGFLALNQALLVGRGGVVFGLLHLVLFYTVWIVVPLMTADCISRERREGTLGLLVLTPLKAWEIVLAKSLAHGLRAASLVLAVIPALAIPVLLGGVSGKEVALSALVLGVSLWLALSAGLLASSFCRERHNAMLWALLLSGCLLWLEAGLIKRFMIQSNLTFRQLGYGYDLYYFSGLDWLTNYHLCWGFLATNIAAPFGNQNLSDNLMHRMASGLAGSAWILVVAIWLAERLLRRAWQENPPPRWLVSAKVFFCTPAYGINFYRRWLNRGLERNPVGWLEKRRWSSRLVSWIWLALAITASTVVMNRSLRVIARDINEMFYWLFWILMLSMSLVAAGSFTRERTSGIMEMLLISPFRERQIISGRLRALWGQFLPATALLIGVWLFAEYYVYRGMMYNYRTASLSVWMSALHFAVLAWTLPVIGLYSSVRCHGYINSIITTLGFGIGLPVLLFKAIWAWITISSFYRATIAIRPEEVIFQAVFDFFLPILLEIALAVFFWYALHRRLVCRQFSLPG